MFFKGGLKLKAVSFLLVVFSVLMLSVNVYAEDQDSYAAIYYVDQNSGNDQNSGSKVEPYKTLAHAVSQAQDDSLIILLSDIELNESARFWDKDITITSDVGKTFTITRGKNMIEVNDPARRNYVPAMIEVNATTGESSLTLKNVILDDGEISDGYYIQADSEGDGSTAFGSQTIQNTDIVQDAMIASYSNKAQIILDDGAILKNYGGMSAVRLSGATMIMKDGSKIYDEKEMNRNKGTEIEDAGTELYGPAGAIWIQGGKLIMEEGSQIGDLDRILNGRAIYADSGSMELSGAIYNIKSNNDMWNGSNGTHVHLRRGASLVLEDTFLADNSDIDTNGIAFYLIQESTLEAKSSILEDGTIKRATLKNLDNLGIYGNEGTKIVFDGEATGFKGNSHIIQLEGEYHLEIGENAYIHHNRVGYGAIYSWGEGGQMHIYGKINHNIDNDHGGAISIANNGGPQYVYMYDGAEIIGNVSGDSGAGIMVSNGYFYMSGGTIANNVAAGKGDLGNGAGVYVRRGGSFIMTGGEIFGNYAHGEGSGVTLEMDSKDHLDFDIYIRLEGGKIYDNYHKVTLNEDKSPVEGTGSINNISIIENNVGGNVKRNIFVSNDVDISDRRVYLAGDDIYVLSERDDVSIGVLSSATKQAIKGIISSYGWNPLNASFWYQHDIGTDVTISSLTDVNEGLPVYAVISETNEEGDIIQGSTKVFTLEKLTEGLEGELSNYENGAAVMLAQPSLDLIDLMIDGLSAIEKDDAIDGFIDIPYDVTIKATESFMSHLKNVEEEPITEFIVKVELDEHEVIQEDMAFTSSIFDATDVTYNGSLIEIECELKDKWREELEGTDGILGIIELTASLDHDDYIEDTFHFASAQISMVSTDHNNGNEILIPSNAHSMYLVADEEIQEPDEPNIKPNDPNDNKNDGSTSKDDYCQMTFGDMWIWSDEYDACVLRTYIVDTSTKRS